ncbi:MAG: hypothetical protein II590_01910 [Clostridia bacterium]|nr:hypothetical protein [Clostridia bacterium]
MKKDSLVIAVEEMLLSRGYKEVVFSDGKRFLKKGANYVRITHLPSFDVGSIIQVKPDGDILVYENDELTAHNPPLTEDDGMIVIELAEDESSAANDILEDIALIKVEDFDSAIEYAKHEIESYLP